MKLFCGAAHPEIGKAVWLFCQNETTTHAKYKNSQNRTARKLSRKIG